MGRVRNHRARTTKNKQYRKQHSTKRRRRDIDQVQDDLRKEEEKGKKIEFEHDEDLPGLGQFYCTPCARHFCDEKTLLDHEKSKVHKRRYIFNVFFISLEFFKFLFVYLYRLKDVAQPQYSQVEAELAAGKTVEYLPPAHPVMEQ